MFNFAFRFILKSMKKLLIVLLSIVSLHSFSQVVNEETKRLFTFGLDVFTDIWQDIPKTVDPKTINPGVNIFGTYNYMFGKSDVSFSPGLGIGVHNMFNSSFIHTNNDSSYFVPINIEQPDISYKKSKFVATYLDIPLEIRYKSKSQFRAAIGFKFGFLIMGHSKYKGDDYQEGTTNLVIYKKKKIDYLETNRYGFTARIGYKWLNLYGYYQLSTLFQENKGPEMYPISVGITIIPF
jgi:hypothetical protein